MKLALLSGLKIVYSRAEKQVSFYAVFRCVPQAAGVLQLFREKTLDIV